MRRDVLDLVNRSFAAIIKQLICYIQVAFSSKEEYILNKLTEERKKVNPLPFS